MQLDTFASLGLSEPILKAIEETGYVTPTPIQLQGIPPVLAGKDVLGIAQTGTGKTAAFALPILHRLAADRKPTPRRGTRALILSPTRELASQIADSFRTYGKHLGFSVVVVFGGVSERPQADKLQRGVDIVVATPGRLLDHVGQKNVTLEHTEIFVLDEADQMLDLGFFKPIRRIVSELPKARQSLFFSATMPKEIEDLTRELLTDPAKIAVTPESTTVERVTQRVIRVEQSKKKALLAELLADQSMYRTLVFTRTKRGADRVAKHLTGAKIEAAAIHGNKSQNQREAALHSFKSGHTRVLVATDIAARGIDIDEVTHVVNFELPEVPEAYVHRIGRTARAGASGAAISFCDEGERHLLRNIEKVTRQTLEAEDRRGDETLVGDKSPARGERPSGEPRDGERPSQARREHKRFSDRERGRGGDRGDRGEGRRERFARPDRGERGGERREGGFGGGERAARPERTDRPQGDRKPWQNRENRGEGRSGGERRFEKRDGDRPRGDRPFGDRGRERDRDANRGDRVWTNDGSRPDRQHRTEGGGRGERSGERRDGERREFRGGDRGGDRGGFRGPRRDGDRPNREGGERRPWNRDERAPREAGAREAGGERREWKPRPPRDGGRFEGRGPRLEGKRNFEGRGPRPEGERGERREARPFDGGRPGNGPRREGFRGGEGRRDGGDRQERRGGGGFDRDRPRHGGGEQRPRNGEGGLKRPAGAHGADGGRPDFRKPRGEGGGWRGRDDKRPPRRDADV